MRVKGVLVLGAVGVITACLSTAFSRSPSASDRWKIEITVQSKVDEETYTDYVYAGVDPNAKDELDDLDIPKGPQAPGAGVCIYFPHPDWPSPYDKLQEDIRAPLNLDEEKEWEFVVNVKKPAQVSLSFEDLPNCGEYRITLKDPEGNEHDLCKEPGVEFKFDTIGERSFILRIRRISCAVTLDSPNGGEKWKGGTEHKIEWTTTGEVDRVTLYYSTDSGQTWTKIGDVENTGSYTWHVPKVDSNKCHIKIEIHCVGCITASDASDNPFTIDSTPPSSEITSPKHDEQVERGTVKIQGYSTDNLTGVNKVEVRIDGGNWVPVDELTEVDGKWKWSYNWDTSGLEGGSEHTIEVRAHDGVGNIETPGQPSIAKNAIKVHIKVPVTIKITSPQPGEKWGGNTTKHIKWDSTGKIDHVGIWYSTDGGKTWSLIAHPTENDGDYEWKVPQVDTKTDALIKIEAHDAEHNVLASDVMTEPFHILPCKSHSFPAGVQMVSIPVQAQNPDWKDILGEESPKVAKWCPECGEYRYYSTPPADKTVVGHGYWLKLDASKEVCIAGDEPNATKEFEIKNPMDPTKGLPEGWNMIGNPWQEPLRWPAFYEKNKEKIEPYGWVYDPEARDYVLVMDAPGCLEELQPWQGMWVKVKKENVTLKVPTPAKSKKGATRRREPLFDWAVRIEVSTGEGKTEVIFGASSNGQPLRVALPPEAPIRPKVRAFLVNKGERLAVDLKDLRSKRAEWEFVVKVSSRGKVTLTWPELGKAPKDLTFTLVDLATGRRVYMRTSGGYCYTPATNEMERRFKIEVSPHRPIRPPIVGKVTRLRSRQLAVSVWLPCEADLKVVVSTLMGRKIGETRGGTRSPGWSTLVLRAERSLSPGVYLVRVTARDGNGRVVGTVKPVVLR